jgi:hypothetical protein
MLGSINFVMGLHAYSAGGCSLARPAALGLCPSESRQVDDPIRLLNQLTIWDRLALARVKASLLQ